jgi:hypothetical protein
VRRSGGHSQPRERHPVGVAPHRQRQRLDLAVGLGGEPGLDQDLDAREARARRVAAPGSPAAGRALLPRRAGTRASHV